MKPNSEQPPHPFSLPCVVVPAIDIIPRAKRLMLSQLAQHYISEPLKVVSPKDHFWNYDFLGSQNGTVYLVFAKSTSKWRVPPLIVMPACTREPGWRRNSPNSNLTTSFASGKKVLQRNAVSAKVQLLIACCQHFH